MERFINRSKWHAAGRDECSGVAQADYIYLNGRPWRAEWLTLYYLHEIT